MTESPGALAGVRVVEIASLVAASEAARHLADFGADILKIEPPGGDATRQFAWRRPEDEDSLYWKILARGKRSVAIDLKSDSGRERALDLLSDAHVLIENLRPGKLEQLGLGPTVLLERNPSLVVVRVSGFGQTGPYAQHPGFATIAEALSGYASLCGDPDGPPNLPPIALTDEVTGLAAAFAAMVAMHHAQRTGEGQVVDISLLETMIQLLGPVPSAFLHLGYTQPRMGSGIPYIVPRGTYRCKDGVWVALSTSAETVAKRVLSVIGLDGDERFETAAGRIAHRGEIDETLTYFIATRQSSEILAIFREADAAIAPVYSVDEMIRDPHVIDRNVFVDIDGVTMQGPLARLSRTPGRISSPAPGLAPPEGGAGSGGSATDAAVVAAEPVTE